MASQHFIFRFFFFQLKLPVNSKSPQSMTKADLYTPSSKFQLLDLVKLGGSLPGFVTVYSQAVFKLSLHFDFYMK